MPIQDNTKDDAADDVRDGQRIAKVMARAGLCSRRDAEQWIAEGRVAVNGQVLTSPAYNVSDSDDIRVDGEPLRAAERTRLFLFHKPRGLVTTAKDPEGRPTIFEALPEDLPRVVTIGRLDINTEGLLLLTNDGGLSRVLELPATGWLRRYRVRAHGEVTQEQLDSLRDGVTIDGVNYLGIEAKFERQQGSNVWLMMGLREGKNREIKRVLEHMGLSVNRLIRVSFGPFELADLPEGEVMEVRSRVLRDQLGPKLAKQAGANFDAPAESVETLKPDSAHADRPQRRSQAQTLREGTAPNRKHVSVLRAQARDDAAGPRKRISRSATADRKGREVQVERVSLANPKPEAPAKRPRRAAPGSAPRSRPRDDAREGFEKRERAPRAEGNFASRPPRSAPREGFEKRERAPRAEGSFASRAPREGFEKRERAPRAEGSFASRPPRSAPREGFEKRERAPRAEGSFASRPPRSAPREGFEKRDRAPRAEGSFASRPPRSAPREGFEKRERAPRAEGSFASRAPREGFEKRERAPRAEGSFASRAPREGSFSSRPPREGAAKRERPAGSFGARPARSEGGDKRERPARAGFSKGPPRGDRPGGGRPKGPPRDSKGPPRGPRKPRG